MTQDPNNVHVFFPKILIIPSIPSVWPDWHAVWKLHIIDAQSILYVNYKPDFSFDACVCYPTVPALHTRKKILHMRRHAAGKSPWWVILHMMGYSSSTKEAIGWSLHVIGYQFTTSKVLPCKTYSRHNIV